MKQTTFIADGKTKIFHFTFPFFLKSDVIIEMDSKPATNYNLICIKNGLNADIPFSGGQVHFNKPPKMASVITIRRVLPLTRLIDYQATAPYDPKALNQDFNYLMEVLKDIKDEQALFRERYADIVDKESTKDILDKVQEINKNVAEQITGFGDISTVIDNIQALQQASSNHGNAIQDLGNAIDNIEPPQMATNPDYSTTPITLSTATNTWIDIPASGFVHINFMTNNAISWLTVNIGNETNNAHFTTQVNAVERGCDATYQVKAGQKIKLSPRGATITTCEIIPFCE